MPLRIGIDLGHTPLLVGACVLGKIIVNKGSNGLKVNVADDLERAEVVGVLKDATSVVKSYFGAPSFDAAVIVVPNTTDFEHQDDIRDFGREAHFNITQVITENLAVAVAYKDKVEPAEDTTLAIISDTSGILDISIVSIVPDILQRTHYSYICYDHKTYPDPIDFEKQESGEPSGGGLFGAIGSAVENLVVDPLEKAFNALHDLLEKIKPGDGRRVDKIVLVGKASKSEKVQQAAKERFDDAEVWTEVEDGEQVAAYGAASACFNDERVELVRVTDAK